MKEIQNFNGKGNENILTLVYENEKVWILPQV